MKTTLFLVLAGATLALSSCQQQETPVTPTTETTAPIVVTPVKSEIASAPSSVAGKTIVFNYSNAKSRGGEVNTIQNAAWEKNTSKSESFTFKNGNIRKFNVKPGDLNSLISQEYKKTGSTTAKLEALYGNYYAEFDLTFTSSKSGTAKKCLGYGENIEETIDITFTIK